ncbi:MAG: arginine repressor [Bacillota bacterium]
MNKSVRHKKIIEIIRSGAIETQEQLAAELGRMGIGVTQATVSRDIKELGLVKIPSGDSTVYALPGRMPVPAHDSRLKRLFAESVQKVDYSENLIIIKTMPGEAQGVASAIDQSGLEGVIGTVAGDDTILVVVKPKGVTEGVMKRFQEMAGGYD